MQKAQHRYEDSIVRLRQLGRVEAGAAQEVLQDGDRSANLATWEASSALIYRHAPINHNPRPEYHLYVFIRKPETISAITQLTVCCRIASSLTRTVFLQGV